MTWYSAGVRHVGIVGNEGIRFIWDTVYLVAAPDRDAAWQEATALGKGVETTYPNPEGEETRWVFAGVMTLDTLGEQITSGQEIWFHPQELSLPLPIDPQAEFFPESVDPQTSGIGTTLRPFSHFRPR